MPIFTNTEAASDIFRDRFGETNPTVYVIPANETE